MRTRKSRPLPGIGSTFKKEYKGESYTLKVVQEEGKLMYYLGGKCYASPSSAAKSVTKTEVNGWRFWGIDKD